MRRQRLDELIVNRGLARDRATARALIMARDVSVDGQVAIRAAEPVDLSVDLMVRPPQKYVGRGGQKLEHALRRWQTNDEAEKPKGILVRGSRCLDVGASIGGFTDCLLQHGATDVTALDVGYGELDPRLRNDPRVSVRERTNARTMTPLQDQVDLATVDVSFISLIMVLPVVIQSVRPFGDLLVLVKPQFEAARTEVEAGGVVRDPRIHASTVARVAVWAVDHGLRVRGVLGSPLRGAAGNREFFLWLRCPAETGKMESP